MVIFSFCNSTSVFFQFWDLLTKLFCSPKLTSYFLYPNELANGNERTLKINTQIEFYVIILSSKRRSVIQRLEMLLFPQKSLIPSPSNARLNNINRSLIYCLCTLRMYIFLIVCMVFYPFIVIYFDKIYFLSPRLTWDKKRRLLLDRARPTSIVISVNCSGLISRKTLLHTHSMRLL